MRINLFWFRRDLRLHDNAGLYEALKSGLPVQGIFIFDTLILDKLVDKTDARVGFLHQTILELDAALKVLGSGLRVYHGNPVEIWKGIVKEYEVDTVFTNHDYEAYGIGRDAEVKSLLASAQIGFRTFKDHVVFEHQEVVKDDQKPYTVFTPYSRKWKAKLDSHLVEYNGEQISYFLKPYPCGEYEQNYVKVADSGSIPSLGEMGFQQSAVVIPSKIVARSVVMNYTDTRNFPANTLGTSRLGIHFRFGTISIREKALAAQKLNETYLNELIWRDFYSMILQHFPHIQKNAFRSEYENIKWRNDEADFQAWCEGRTGYAIVDAGMRELNATGIMHNRVRMITASFLTKHLLLDWRWGEAYFAQKLLDFDLASNNGGWQWAAGCGTDAAPYFRIFNPITQQENFDKAFVYVKRWVPEYGTAKYSKPVVDHKMARERCLATYKEGLDKKPS
jgi:deoxyribodipyrimidine photo-lyase